MHIIPSVSTHTLMHIHCVSRGAWLHRSIFKITFKMVHFKDVLTYSLGNREETNARLQVYTCL